MLISDAAFWPHPSTTGLHRSQRPLSIHWSILLWRPYKSRSIPAAFDFLSDRTHNRTEDAGWMGGDIDLLISKRRLVQRIRTETLVLLTVPTKRSHDQRVTRLLPFCINAMLCILGVTSESRLRPPPLRSESSVLAERVEAAVRQSNRGERRTLVKSLFVAFMLIERRVGEVSPTPHGGFWPRRCNICAPSCDCLSAALHVCLFIRLFIF